MENDIIIYYSTPFFDSSPNYTTKNHSSKFKYKEKYFKQVA